MPRYDFRCESCGAEWEGWARVNEAVKHPCGGVATRLISAVAIRADNLDAQSYYDHGLGQRITSRSERKRLMAANNLVEADTGNIRPHGAKGTVFSFGGQATTSVPASGAFARKG